MAATTKTRVLVLFGGRSSEHEVSCMSARNVLAAMDPDRYVVTTVGITRDGRWTLLDAAPEAPPGGLPSVGDEGDTVALVHTRKGPRLVRFGDTFDGEEIGPVDVCFPILHGPYGEDGTVQGLLASHGVPYVGADVAASAIGIDKRQMKNVFKARGLPQVPHLAVRRYVWEADRGPVIDDIEAALAYPVFTKPSRQGSSIGIRKCDNREELLTGVAEAFSYDRVAIVEASVEGARELECGVLGNTEIDVTPPGEVVTGHEFYDFEGKYLDAGLVLRCPAEVSDDVRDRCVDYARQAFLAIGARGMSRVDFFYLEHSGRVLVNEINTIPGFTAASMFPRIWSAHGLEPARLIDRLLELALEASQASDRYAP
ncbi:MAG TPA: D-alanine--D-alanine ligase family protein [Egibacteraceae bacterium]|nr:D-alanine--D-alanine ligase family protein [Egibacteraceae bacterium]